VKKYYVDVRYDWYTQDSTLVLGNCQ